MMRSGANSTTLCISLAKAPMRPGVTEDPTSIKDDRKEDDEVNREPTSVLLLALDMLKAKEMARSMVIYPQVFMALSTFD